MQYLLFHTFCRIRRYYSWLQSSFLQGVFRRIHYFQIKGRRIQRKLNCLSNRKLPNPNYHSHNTILRPSRSVLENIRFTLQQCLNRKQTWNIHQMSHCKLCWEIYWRSKNHSIYGMCILPKIFLHQWLSSSTQRSNLLII